MGSEWDVCLPASPRSTTTKQDSSFRSRLVKDNAVGEEIYESLQKAGIEVLYDDRKESAGVKFADADLIGLPIRITIGNRSLKEGKVEVKIRETDETMSFLVSDLADEVKATIARLQKEIDENIIEKELD